MFSKPIIIIKHDETKKETIKKKKANTGEDRQTVKTDKQTDRLSGQTETEIYIYI